MEKITFRNSRGLNLVGDFYRVDSEKGIVMAHGFTGDRHEWGSFDLVAHYLHADGYNVLTFDFSGCGESDDEELNVTSQVDDLICAIRWIKGKGIKNLGLFGHSLGGLVALRNYQNADALILTAPVTDKNPDYRNFRLSQNQRKELEEKGHYTKTRDKGVRKKFVIDSSYVEVRENLNQDSLLSPVNYPILIIHGDIDDVIPLEWSERAIRKLPNGSKLEVISGGNHDFIGSDEVIGETIKWFNQHL